MALHPTMPWRSVAPVDRCYWAILDASSLALGTGVIPSRRVVEDLVAARSPALDAALQRWLPIPVEGVHAVYAAADMKGGGHVVIACAVEREVLDQLAAAPGILWLTPAELPAALSSRLAEPLSTDALNLLVGEYEPAQSRRLRTRTRRVAAAAAVLLVAGVAVGVVRRAGFSEARAAALDRAAEQVVTRLVPGAPTVELAVARAAAESRRLRVARLGPGAAEQTLDAPAALVSVLSRWPRDAHRGGLYIRTHAIQITPTGITLTALVPAEADAEPLIAALRAMPDWSLQQSQRTAVTGGGGRSGDTNPMARLVLRLVPRLAGTAAGGAS